ncbi:MAG: hypothetical protein JW786_11985 [Desulfobacterales bacterium]|nr:hypothetical protein [Desulfobacterales bacterium]
MEKKNNTNIPVRIKQLEDETNITEEMKTSKAYLSLSNEAKIILLLMMNSKEKNPFPSMLG